MPNSANGLTICALLLMAGCASPFSSGSATRNRSEAPAAGQVAAVPTSPQSNQNAQAAERKAADDPSGDKSVFERRIAELLAAASKRQQAGRLDVAQYGYEQVLRLDPQNMKAHYQLACIADDQRRFADAEQHYTVLLGLAPHNPDLLASLGWSYLLQGRNDDCERVLREALRYAPNHQTALYNLGWLYGTRGNFDQAVAIFRSAGTEADAQRALAELQQNVRPHPGAATEAYAAAPVNSAPAPWNDNRTDTRDPSLAAQNVLRGTGIPPGTGQHWTQPSGTNPGGSLQTLNDRPPFPGNSMFSEIDAYARSSPTQANHARQVESQTVELGLDGRARDPSVIRPGSTDALRNDPAVGLAGGRQAPMITPGIPGPGAIRAVTGIPAGNISSSTFPAGDSAANNATTMTHAAEWSRPVPRDSRLPEWTNSAGPRNLGVDPQGIAATRREPASRQDAHLTAAQLGLGAGPGGVLLPMGDWTSSPVGPEATGSRSAVPIPAGEVGGGFPRPENSLPGQQPALSRQPPVTQTAGFPPAQSPPAPGLPSWPGRPSILAPVPTDVRVNE
jgi:Flp pilus assembly protein TadD